MNIKWIRMCSIVSVFSMYAMENENKTILKQQPRPIDKSPQIKKVKTLEDIETIEKDEFKHARRRSRSLENFIDPFDINFEVLLAQTSTLAIKEFDTNPKNIKQYRSMSNDQLKQSTSKLQLPNLSPLTIKE